MRHATWKVECNSWYFERNGNLDRVAEFYQFEVNGGVHTIIDLSSDGGTPALDPFLVLWKHVWPDAVELVASNDDNEETATAASRIARELDLGTYTIEATLSEDPSSTASLDFKLELNISELIPYLGHQADHTVQYRIGTMQPTMTPTPTPTPIYGPVPPAPIAVPTPASSSLPDPAFVIPKAMPTAVKAWNEAVATAWPEVLFCEREPVTDTVANTAPVPCPTRTHDDNKSVVINVVDGERHKTRVRDNVWDHVISGTIDSCGTTIACVFPDPLTAISHLNAIGNGHLGNLEMRIEEPPWGYAEDEDTGARTHVRYVWTNNVKKHGHPAMEGKIFVYLPSVFMHEFGHAAGLADLYLKEYDDTYAGFLMKETHKATRIPGADIDYIHQLYRNIHPGKPH